MPFSVEGPVNLGRNVLNLYRQIQGSLYELVKHSDTATWYDKISGLPSSVCWFGNGKTGLCN